MFAGKYLIQENTNLPKSENPIYSQTGQPDQTDDESLWRSINSALIMNSILSTPYRWGWRPCYQCSAEGGERTFLMARAERGSISFQWRIRTWRTIQSDEAQQRWRPGEWSNNEIPVWENRTTDTPIIPLRFAIKSRTKCICVLRKQLLVLLFVSRWTSRRPEFRIQCLMSHPSGNSVFTAKERTSWRSLHPECECSRSVCLSDCVRVLMKRGYICVRQILIKVWKMDFKVGMRQVL